MSFEVEEPIQNSPYEEPQRWWYIQEGEMPHLLDGRRASVVFPPRNQKTPWTPVAGLLKKSDVYANAFELEMVNVIRERLARWRESGYSGMSRTTRDLLTWWTREGRKQPLFYAQIEAALTIIFLTEGRSDLRQGISVPRDEPGDKRKSEGYAGFLRYACKMATGAGKTTVMGMLSAWSILNKVNDRKDARFSDVVLVVCPNVTIRDRLQELDPKRGDACIYRTRDLVPAHMMPLLTQGTVLVTNWHVFAPQTSQTGGDSAKVTRAGIRKTVEETVLIGDQNTTSRGKRYMTFTAAKAQADAGELEVLSEEKDANGHLKSIRIRSVKYVESDTAIVRRVLGRSVGGKLNILVLNDEAHHAYRVLDQPDEDELIDLEEDEAKNYFDEATVWMDGLDKVQKLRGINVCIDLSATPYFLGRVGRETNKPFPWIVSDFSLLEAIESGLVKVPQLAVRDPSGADIASYFNIWSWMLPKMSASERGANRASPKPEAVLKFAHTPVVLLGKDWDQQREEWLADPERDSRPPVYIMVCKNTAIAKAFYAWIANGEGPATLPALGVEALRNMNGRINTIRVDSKVVNETDSGVAKSDESRWMRYTLDTVGKLDWSRDSQGRAIYPEGFEAIAAKLSRPLHPPGRDVRCIVSVGMLTEGWDCNTVTHIIGIRPFMSQLLCEQVVGRGLRRFSYEVDERGRLPEEVSRVFGVPFEVVPYKANPTGNAIKPKRFLVRAIPDKAEYEITFPRVEGYTQAVRNRLTIDWAAIAPLRIDPLSIPNRTELTALSINSEGRPTLSGPGKATELDLKRFREQHRVQQLIFDIAGTLTREYHQRSSCAIPVHSLFRQLLPITERYIYEKVQVPSASDLKDVFCNPWYGWIVENLLAAIRPDTSTGEAPEIPVYEKSRAKGTTADVSYWTSKEVRAVLHSHINYVVADTKIWEQSAAYYIDKHKSVRCFAKNAGLRFAIPYIDKGDGHDYFPDFLICFKDLPQLTLILETKGYDEKEDAKVAGARRWVAAVNAEGSQGKWAYEIVKHPTEVYGVLERYGAQPNTEHVTNTSPFRHQN